MTLSLAGLLLIKPMMINSKLTPSEKVLSAIPDNKTITAPALMGVTGLLSGSVYRALSELEADKAIVKIDGHPRSYKKAGLHVIA